MPFLRFCLCGLSDWLTHSLRLTDWLCSGSHLICRCSRVLWGLIFLRFCLCGLSDWHWLTDWLTERPHKQNRRNINPHRTREHLHIRCEPLHNQHIKCEPLHNLHIRCAPLYNFSGFKKKRCCQMNIVGRTELPVTAAVASNYERLHAKFRDDRTIDWHWLTDWLTETDWLTHSLRLTDYVVAHTLYVDAHESYGD
jgi:hypothetical protein